MTGSLPLGWSTGLSAALLDRWIQEGGREQMLARLHDPEVRRRVRREMVESLDRRGGADRGIIRVGAIADLAVIDPATVRDTATFTDQHQLSEDMVHVLVNGQLVIDGARFTGALPGQVLSQR